MSLATPTTLACCGMALCLGISGCATTPFGDGVTWLVAPVLDAQPECESDSGISASAGTDRDASPEPSRFQRLASGALRKTETFARGTMGATLGATGGALLGALGGAGAALYFGAQSGGCLYPSTCGSLVAGMALLGAIVGGAIGAVEGTRYALGDSNRRHGSAESCARGQHTELLAHRGTETVSKTRPIAVSDPRTNSE